MSADEERCSQEVSYRNLLEYICTNNGSIHDSLILKEESSDARGIYAQEDIAKGSLLVLLPLSVAVSGQDLPLSYKYRNEAGDTLDRTASAWLRCVTALIIRYAKNKQTDGIMSDKYIQSLPVSYDTLLHESSWPTEEVVNYLSGTTIGNMICADRKSNTLRQRFEQSVKPYLDSNKQLLDIEENDTIDEEMWQKLFTYFETACACVSTRGFHWKNDEENAASYSGPFLLPFIDLLNHTSNKERNCTILQRRSMENSGYNNQSSSAFFMYAERDIQKGEEILHSYGSLTSGQLMQTFGFIEQSLMERAANDTFENDCENITPCILSRNDIIQVCMVISASNIPQLIKDKIEDVADGSGEEYDVWDLPGNSLADRNTNIAQKSMPEEIMIDYENPLSDELITLCCSQFLPDEVFEEVCETYNEGDASETILTTLSSDILEDFFLGCLVLKSIQRAIEMKLIQYCPVTLNEVGDEEPDEEKLKSLLKSCSSNSLHAMYGLTLRLEEKACLRQLSKECSKHLNNLGYTTENTQKSSECDKDRNSKRIKL